MAPPIYPPDMSHSISKKFNPPGWPVPPSHSAVALTPAHAQLLHIAGQIGTDPHGNTPESFEGQVKVAFANLKEVLRAGGATAADVVKIGFFVVGSNMERLTIVGNSLMEFLGTARPPSTYLHVAGLAMPEWMFEVECVAAIPPPTVQIPLAIRPAAVEYDVVVVGAGLSGLEAARNVQNAGLRVIVLEAKDCIGGKTRTVSNDGKGFIELGAAWINDTNQSEMWAMAQKYGMETVVQRAEGLDCVQDKDKSVLHVPYGETGVSIHSFYDFMS
jgi:monoamine oxidase